MTGVRALRRHWALGASLGAHALALGLLLLRFEPAPLPAASASVDLSVSVPAIEPVSEVRDTPNLVATAAAPAAAAAVDPPQETATAIEAPTEHVRAMSPERIEPAQPVEVVDEAVPQVIRNESVDPVETLPAPPPARPAPPAVKPVAMPATKPPSEPSVAQATPPAEPLPERKAQAAPSSSAGEARQTSQASAGQAGPPPDYLMLLRAWLERHKEYPRLARARGQQGRAVLRLTIDRQGHVTSQRIERSTGHAALDREVEAMIRRADPLPAPPPDMLRNQLELIVPVEFFLR